MANQLIAFIASNQLKDRKFTRLVFNTIILLITLTIMTLGASENYDIDNLLTDVIDRIIIFTSICYMSTLYSYGYKKALFKHQWQLFLVSYLTVTQAMYIVGYTIFSLYGKVTILFLLPYSIFWLLFYCYIIYTINNLKNDLEEYI